MELKKCPFCGGEAKNEIDMPWRFVQCCQCGTTGPEFYSAAEAESAWNKRYVCDDKNGKALFVGDPVKHCHGTGTLVADMVGGIGIKVHENLTIALTPLESCHIELIEEVKDE